MQSIDGIFDAQIPDTTTKAELRDRLIGEVSRAMKHVFPDLKLAGVGGAGSSGGSAGTFYFDKGSATNFLYKNLSAGEKAAFDLILDIVVKREFYDNSIWCIDEPEAHLNTRIQGLLLEALLDLMPENCQLWLASHSIGFMRKAWEMSRQPSHDVVFVDLQDCDFDQCVVMAPINPSRDFWARTLDVALGDLATLVAPQQVILCEGRPSKGDSDRKSEFDARCYRKIFAEQYADTDFVSVGNSFDVGQDRLDFGRTIQALTSGTQVIRLVDRDLKSDEEVSLLQASGIRVLGRRHIEAYLLDDEVIEALCNSVGQPDKTQEAFQIKRNELEASISRGNDVDDYKSAAGSIYVGLRRILSLARAGSDWNAFAVSTLAGLVRPGTSVYSELQQDIFGPQA